MIRWKESSELRNEDIEALYVVGDLDLLVVRRRFTAAYVRSVASRFWAAPPRRREPPAAGYEVGTHHFGCELDTYFARVDRSRARVEEVLSGPEGNEVAGYQAEIGDMLSRRGVGFRPAQHRGLTAASCIVRSWESELAGSPYALAPHDDIAQLAHREQAGFEIQGVRPSDLLATNICVDRRSGGELIVWDRRPTDADRLAFGLSRDAYPYPEKYLSDAESVQILMGPGDVVTLRGELVHAVTASPRRVVVSYFSALLTAEQAIYWS